MTSHCWNTLLTILYGPLWNNWDSMPVKLFHLLRDTSSSQSNVFVLYEQKVIAMTIALPFVRLTTPAHGAEPEALLGFSLSSGPRSSKHTSSNEKERLREALQSQVNL